ncbi:hypothetical protein [Citricoccus alkalitolerans]|uniref:Uncharacterized protein n=1 Tax=Citricoccus alkalitolerans TaxID=246603 RepID=A0ABV8XVE9_9MICC
MSLATAGATMAEFGLTVAGIAAAFWGFLAGALVSVILSFTLRRRHPGA